MSNINEMLTSLRFFAKRHPQPYTEMIETIEAVMLEKDSEIEKLQALLSEVADSMQVSPIRMELRGRIRAALKTENKE